MNKQQENLKQIKQRLEYLRTEIENETISYSEIAELQGLKQYIDKNCTLLLEWAGVDETRCHLCGSIEKNHYCTNESCYEFTKYED